jgi:hypothetical protein
MDEKSQGQVEITKTVDTGVLNSASVNVSTDPTTVKTSGKISNCENAEETKDGIADAVAAGTFIIGKLPDNRRQNVSDVDDKGASRAPAEMLQTIVTEKVGDLVQNATDNSATAGARSRDAADISEKSAVLMEPLCAEAKGARFKEMSDTVTGFAVLSEHAAGGAKEDCLSEIPLTVPSPDRASRGARLKEFGVNTKKKRRKSVKSGQPETPTKPDSDKFVTQETARRQSRALFKRRFSSGELPGLKINKDATELSRSHELLSKESNDICAISEGKNNVSMPSLNTINQGSNTLNKVERWLNQCHHQQEQLNQQENVNASKHYDKFADSDYYSGSEMQGTLRSQRRHSTPVHQRSDSTVTSKPGGVCGADCTPEVFAPSSVSTPRATDTAGGGQIQRKESNDSGIGNSPQTQGDSKRLPSHHKNHVFHSSSEISNSSSYAADISSLDSPATEDESSLMGDADQTATEFSSTVTPSSVIGEALGDQLESSEETGIIQAAADVQSNGEQEAVGVESKQEIDPQLTYPPLAQVALQPAALEALPTSASALPEVEQVSDRNAMGIGGEEVTELATLSSPHSQSLRSDFRRKGSEASAISATATADGRQITVHVESRSVSMQQAPSAAAFPAPQPRRSLPPTPGQYAFPPPLPPSTIQPPSVFDTTSPPHPPPPQPVPVPLHITSAVPIPPSPEALFTSAGFGPPMTSAGYTLPVSLVTYGPPMTVAGRILPRASPFTYPLLVTSQGLRRPPMTFGVHTQPTPSFAASVPAPPPHDPLLGPVVQEWGQPLMRPLFVLARGGFSQFVYVLYSGAVDLRDGFVDLRDVRDLPPGPLVDETGKETRLLLYVFELTFLV